MGKQSPSKQRRRERRKDVEKFGAQRRADEARSARIEAERAELELIRRAVMTGPLLSGPEHFRTEGVPVGATEGGRRGHAHAEAFALMLYANEDGSAWEWIWNSRDGVTPFIVSVRLREVFDPYDARQRLTHVHFDRDRYVPDYVPQPGERVFVSMTRERARELATLHVERHWDDPKYPRARYASKEEAIAAIASEYFGNGNNPDLVEVGPEGWAAR